MNLDQALDLAALGVNCCDEATHRFWWWAITQQAPPVKEGVAIEIGCAVGGGSTTLAAACEAKGLSLHCFDTWYTDMVDYQKEGPQRHRNWEIKSKGYPDFVRHVDQLRRAGLNHLVLRHVGDSKRLARTFRAPCVFLWIDGGHYWPQPYFDFLAFGHLVVPGGIVGFHDVDDAGLPKTFEELEKQGLLKGWREIKGLPRKEWVLPEGQKRISYHTGFSTRAWERVR